MPPCDWSSAVGAKTTSNAQLAPVITRLSRPGARVVLLQNGLAVEEQLRPLLPDNLHLLGGLCFICTHRAAPGVIEHQALGAVNLGYHSDRHAQARAWRSWRRVPELFRSAGLESVAMADLQQARWQLVWNVPYNGLSVLLGAGTTRLMANADSRALIFELMREVVQGAAAVGKCCQKATRRNCWPRPNACRTTRPACTTISSTARWSCRPIHAAPLAAAAAAGCELPKCVCCTRPCVFWMPAEHCEAQHWAEAGSPGRRPCLRSILYATDLGLYAPYVLQHALSLAKAFGAELHVVHAVEPMGLFAESVLQTYLDARRP